MNDLTIAVREYARKVSGLIPLSFNLCKIEVNIDNPKQFQYYDRLYETSAFAMLDIMDKLNDHKNKDERLVYNVFVKEINTFTS